MGQKKYPIPYDINKIMTYLGVTILFSAHHFIFIYVRESYIIREIVRVWNFPESISIHYNEKETYLKLLKAK
jgi:hypothetical protein